jgi:hypothetical protein
MPRVACPSNHWATPQQLYDHLDSLFGFDDFDPCPFNCDLNKFDGLKVPWADTTFCNPPYSLKGKTAFVTKALEESMLGKTAVLLLPVSTSTELFHEVIQPHGSITFLDHRPRYEGINTKGEWCNPYTGRSSPSFIEFRKEAEKLGLKKVKSGGAHDSMVVVFGSKMAPTFQSS